MRTSDLISLVFRILPELRCGTERATLDLRSGADGMSRVARCTGWRTLRLLASALKVDHRRAMGREFETQNIQSALHAHFKNRQSESAG